jgi:hypothetical protein
MKSIPVAEGEIVNIIRSLKHKNSTGYDNTSTKIIKYCAMEISKPLRYIFNCSLQEGTCPERFKYSVVRPIYKKGDKTRMTNYRQISLIIIFSKILETIMLLCVSIRHDCCAIIYYYNDMFHILSRWAT